MIRITPDKWKHFFVGLFLGAVVYLFIYYFLKFRTVTIIAVTLGAVVTVSYVFELFSLVTGKGHYEFLDAFAGILGGGTAIAVLIFTLS